VSLLEENMRVLARHHPDAAALVAEAVEPSGRIVVLTAASGVPTATLWGIHLHSRHDPAREAERQARHDIDASDTAVIALGFGLGYGVEAARAVHPEKPLLVIEPDRELFRAALASRDVTRLLSDPGVSFYVAEEPEGLPPLLESLPLARACLLRLRPALQAAPGLYRPAEELYQSWLLRRDVNANTLARFGRLWVRNLCRNIRAFVDCAGVSTLAGLFDGIPALVIAGGPTLDEIGPRLPELRRRMLLVAVNTPLRACAAWGVEPDFAVVVDPQYWASRYLDWAGAEGCLLVAEPSACPRVFHGPPGPFFLCSSLFPLGETLESAVGSKGPLGAGGSVSTSAWDFARLLGCRPLYAAGLDLGFPGLRTHCRGVFAEETWLAESGRLAPVESRSFASLRDIGLFPVRSASGGRVATDRRMLLYKWWFENQLAMHPCIEAFTLGASSAAIEGMPLATLEEALALPEARDSIDARLAEARSLHARDRAEHGAPDALLGVIGELEAQLGELVGLARQGRALSDELAGILGAGGDATACLRGLDGIDARILALSARNIAGFLVQSVIHEILGHGGQAAGTEQVIGRSRAMYEGIGESATWQRGMLMRAAEALSGGGGSR
jgi:hypothetical protein